VADDLLLPRGFRPARASSLDRRDRVVRRVTQFAQRTPEDRPGSTDPTQAVHDHALPSLQAVRHELTRPQHAIPLERWVARLVASDEILERDLIDGEWARVVVPRMETNDALKSETVERRPISLGNRERHPGEWSGSFEEDEEAIRDVTRNLHLLLGRARVDGDAGQLDHRPAVALDPLAARAAAAALLELHGAPVQPKRGVIPERALARVTLDVVTDE
jgi:hypothetical protein